MCFLMRLGILIKLLIYLFYFIRIIRYFVERYTYEVKNCDLDLSVEWFQLLFRKIKLT